MRTTIALLIVFSFSSAGAQENYIHYHHTFNRIDNDVLSGNAHTALNRLDSIYREYTFIFAKHCFKALQIACMVNDSVHAELWLEKAFTRGVPIWMIRNNELTRRIFSYHNSKTTLSCYDSLHSVYKASINIQLAKQVDSLLEIDQRATGKVNNGFILFRHTVYGLQWLWNNKKQHAEIKKIIDEYGYPGERLIGLPAEFEDSALMFKQFRTTESFLTDYRCYIMLIHCYSSPRKEINAQLMSAVRTGNVPPAHYGAINDFIAKWGKKKNAKDYYYNVWHTDTNNIGKINARRASIGLSSYQEQLRNDALIKERRELHLLNATVIPE